MTGEKDWFSRHVGKWFFRLFGISTFGFALWNLYSGKVAEFSAASAVGFVCFAFAEMERFKFIKTALFEAEFWENKQKEVDELIGRLHDIVSIYSREVLRSRLSSDRWGTGPFADKKWVSQWKLLKSLEGEHSKLGRPVDLGEARKMFETFLIFDAGLPIRNVIRKSVTSSHENVRRQLNEEFGSPVKDHEGYNARLKLLRDCSRSLGEPVHYAYEKRLASELLEWLNQERTGLQEGFKETLVVPDTVESDLLFLRSLESQEPMAITDAVIERVTQIIDLYEPERR